VEGCPRLHASSDCVSFYQPLPAPAIAASVTRVLTRPVKVITSLIAQYLPTPGHDPWRTWVDGTRPGREGITHLGEFQSFSTGVRTVMRRLEAVHYFAIALAVATGVVTGMLTISGYWGELPLGSVALLGAIAAVAERRAVRVGSHVETSVAAIPLLFSAVVYGPGAAMVVGACALVGEIRAPHARWVVWMLQRTLVGALVGVVASVVMAGDPSVVHMFLAVAAAASAEALADTFLAAVTVALRHPGRFWETLKSLGRVALATVYLYTPLITILAFAHAVLSPWALLLFLAPALAAQHLLTLYQDQRKLANDLLNVNEDLAAATVSFSTALVTALDARDAYTAGHSASVAAYAGAIAAELGLSEGDQHRAFVAGLLHDIGKVGLPAGILEKEGPLTPDERRVMETHSRVGERILESVHGYSEIALIVRSHHERVDGCGYPDGLSGETIPLISRIIAVADAYDAMTSGRPYRAALDDHVARERMYSAAGTQFDSSVVEAFAHVLERQGSPGAVTPQPAHRLPSMTATRVASAA
jgi:putative nucleotidyltransferase with HDIG domain